MGIRKYFIAIVPPGEIAGKVAEIKQYIAGTYHSKGALRAPAHITLHMPFEYDERHEERLTGCLAAFRFAHAVPVQLRHYACFEPRVIFIDVVPHKHLFQLQQQLVWHLRSNLHLLNQAASLRGFHPHMTVAFRDLKKPLFYQAWEEFQQRSFEADFSCHSVCLLRSENGTWQVHRIFDFL